MLPTRLKQIFVLYHRVGITNLIRMSNLAIQKRARSYISYSRYNNCYRHKIIYIAGLGNSGSTWMANLCASLPGFELYTPKLWHQSFQIGSPDEHPIYRGALDEFPKKLVVIKSHSAGTTENINSLHLKRIPYIITVRDPRDVLISQYYYIRRTPHHIHYSIASRVSLGDYITQSLVSGNLELSILSWIRTWIQNRDTQLSMIVRFEDMIADTEKHLRLALNHLGIELDARTLTRIIDLQSFERQTGRQRGHLLASSNFRKGIAGEWQDEFSDEQKLLFHKHGEDTITSLGYQPTL
jgi:Sulfotransferase domain